MIHKCTASDFKRIYEIINNAARAYKGIIPAEYWKEPYMSGEELRHELDEGIEMWGYEENGKLIGVMGIQHSQGVTLIRHAYVCTIHSSLLLPKALTLANSGYNRAKRKTSECRRNSYVSKELRLAMGGKT